MDIEVVVKKIVKRYWIPFVIGMGIGVLIIIMKVEISGWIVLNLILFLIFNRLVIPLHELGHYLAAQMMGIAVSRVVLGNGREIIRVKWMNTWFIFTNKLKTGLTLLGHMSGRLMKLRLFIFTLGGMGMQVLLAYLCFVIFGYHPEEFLTGHTVRLADAFITSNVLSVIINLVPHSFQYNGYKINNDGLRLLKNFFMKPADIQEILSAGSVSDAFELYEKKDYAGAEKIYVDAVLKYPLAELVRINLSVCYIKQMKIDEALSLYDQYDFERVDRNIRPLIYNNLAWLYLLKHDEISIEAAGKFAEKAFQLNPAARSINNTYACCLIELKEVQKGIDILKKEVKLSDKIDDIFNPAIGFIYIAYGYYLVNDMNTAREYVNKIEPVRMLLSQEDTYLLQQIEDRANNLMKCS